MATSSPIIGTVDYVRQLLSVVHPVEELKQKGFVTNYLEEQDFKMKQRCRNCNKRVGSRPPRMLSSGNADDRNGAKWSGSGSGSGPSGEEVNIQKSCSTEQSLRVVPTTAMQAATKAEAPANKYINNVSQKTENKYKPNCQYHPGNQGQSWNCCRAAIGSPGCKTALHHDPPPSLTLEFMARYQVHRTPRRQPDIPKAMAVAIDCEMGTAFDGETALIRVTMIDYFTSHVYIDTLVYPDVPLQHYNTKYSGVTRAEMNKARRNGTCLFGEAAARAAIWQFVNDETVVVGHDVNNDLAALKWLHTVVVDSLLLESAARKRAEAIQKAEEEAAKAEAAGDDEGSTQMQQSDDLGSKDGGAGEEPKKPKNAAEKSRERAARKAQGLSLKALTNLLLGRVIQQGKGHNSLEDAVASRDIVHYHVTRRLNEAYV